MKPSKTKLLSVAFLGFIGLRMILPAHGAPLRSFAIMPVEKEGYVMRLTVERIQNVKSNMLMTNIAYGISTYQALLLGIPFALSPSTKLLGDVSVLYRHVVWQEETAISANRFGFLLGATIPTGKNQNAAIQKGMIFTHIKNRNQVDIDVLYQAGLGQRTDSGRYDISWQHRLHPSERTLWGVTHELNSVLEYNGRWSEGLNTTHQMTVGLQWIQKKWVLEGGAVKDLNNKKELRYNISTRFHF